MCDIVLRDMYCPINYVEVVLALVNARHQQLRRAWPRLEWSSVCSTFCRDHHSDNYFSVPDRASRCYCQRGVRTHRATRSILRKLTARWRERSPQAVADPERHHHAQAGPSRPDAPAPAGPRRRGSVRARHPSTRWSSTFTARTSPSWRAATKSRRSRSTPMSTPTARSQNDDHNN